MKWLVTVRRSCLALVTTGCLMASVQAQDAELVEAATAYVMLPEVQQMIQETFAAESYSSMMASSLPKKLDPTPEQLTEIGQLMAERMSPLRPVMEQAIIDSTARHLTLAEIQALITFYQSPEGASVMAKMQPMMQEAMAVIMPRIVQVNMEMEPEISRILGVEK